MKAIALTNLLAAAGALNTGFAAASPQTVPAAKTVGEATFTSGGIGEEDAKAFQQAATGYPLEVEFLIKATPRDEYTSDVNVQIVDARGNTVLTTVSEGPFLLVKLPRGQYRISATASGKTEVRTVDITPGHHQRVVFVWAA